jgi:hypothetical protein
MSLKKYLSVCLFCFIIESGTLPVVFSFNFKIFQNLKQNQQNAKMFIQTHTAHRFKAYLIISLHYFSHVSTFTGWYFLLFALLFYRRDAI